MRHRPIVVYLAILFVSCGGDELWIDPHPLTALEVLENYAPEPTLLRPTHVNYKGHPQVGRVYTPLWSTYKEKDKKTGQVKTKRRASYGGCSGTLIAPDIVLTAEHCIDDLRTNKGASWTFTTIDGRKHRVKRGEPHKDSDIALIWLEKPIQDIPPLPIMSVKPKVGTPLVLVGYGCGPATKRTGGQRWARRRQDGTEVTSVSFNYIRYRGIESLCSGDSGGPALHAITDTVIAVASGVRPGKWELRPGQTLEELGFEQTAYWDRTDHVLGWLCGHAPNVKLDNGLTCLAASGKLPPQSTPHPSPDLLAQQPTPKQQPNPQPTPNATPAPAATPAPVSPALPGRPEIKMTFAIYDTCGSESCIRMAIAIGLLRLVGIPIHLENRAPDDKWKNYPATEPLFDVVLREPIAGSQPVTTTGTVVGEMPLDKLFLMAELMI